MTNLNPNDQDHDVLLRESFQRELDASSLVCDHGMFDPDKVTDAKRVCSAGVRGLLESIHKSQVHV